MPYIAAQKSYLLTLLSTEADLLDIQVRADTNPTCLECQNNIICLNQLRLHLLLRFSTAAFQTRPPSDSAVGGTIHSL